MVSASVINKSFMKVNQNLLCQVGTINIPVLLSELIFCNTFPIHGNGENSKMTTYVMKSKIYLSLRALSLVNRQNIEGVSHLF